MISIRSPNLSRKRLLRKEPNSTGPRDPCQNGPQMLSLRSFGTLPRNWTWKDALMCPNTAHLAHREWLDAFLQQFRGVTTYEYLIPVIQPISGQHPNRFRLSQSQSRTDTPKRSKDSSSQPRHQAILGVKISTFP